MYEVDLPTFQCVLYNTLPLSLILFERASLIIVLAIIQLSSKFSQLLSVCQRSLKRRRDIVKLIVL